MDVTNQTELVRVFDPTYIAGKNGSLDKETWGIKITWIVPKTD
jgi:hypothetical protein